MKNRVRVVHGVHDSFYSIAGTRIGRIRKCLAEVYNIPPNAAAWLNGTKVNDEHRVAAGDNLEFSRASGCKGSHEFWSEKEIAELLGSAVFDLDHGIEPHLEMIYSKNDFIALSNLKVGARTGENDLSIFVDDERMELIFDDVTYSGFTNTVDFRLLKLLSRRLGSFATFNWLKWHVWEDEHTSDGSVSKAISRLRESLKTKGVEGLKLDSTKHKVALKRIEPFSQEKF